MVRDALLEIPPVERDWLVLGASHQDMLDAGYLPVSGGFPVYLHPETGEEYALARRETKSGPGYKGFDVYTGPEVTLEEDLARRDLTINAMAQHRDGLVFPIEISLSSIDLGTEQVVTAIIRDIRARKESEAELRRLNRTHAVLSRCSRILAETVDEDDLLPGARAARAARTTGRLAPEEGDTPGATATDAGEADVLVAVAEPEAAAPEADGAAQASADGSAEASPEEQVADPADTGS